jgi:hypothetical protein
VPQEKRHATAALGELGQLRPGVGH